MEFQQSKTYSNIQSAYERELMVSTLYSIYADRARLDDILVNIAENFEFVARNEKEHARIFLKQMNNGIVPSTQDNLLSSAESESEAGNTYREYANTARDEGYTELAALFNGIANIELNHNLLFRNFYDNVVRGEVLCQPSSSLWICLQCGNIMSGDCAPAICPVCGFPQGYYKLYNDSGNF